MEWTCTQQWCIDICSLEPTIILSDSPTVRIYLSTQSSSLDLLFQLVSKLINTRSLNINPPITHSHKYTQTHQTPARLFLLMVISRVMMTELWLWLTYWWLMAMLSDSCQPPWLRCQGPPQDLFQLTTSAATALHTQTCWLSASAGPAWKDFSDRLSANDSHHDGGWEKEDTACHFDSCNSSSNWVAPCQSLDSRYIPS